MLSLGLGYTLEPGLDFKTGAHEGPGHDHWGGRPLLLCHPWAFWFPSGLSWDSGGHSPFYRHPKYIHLHLALGPFEGNP